MTQYPTPKNLRVSLSLAFLFLTMASPAQTNPYPADLAALRSMLQKMPSFKTQIRSEKLSDYNTLYRQMSQDTMHSPNSYQYFYNLCRLLFPLQDNHLGFYQLPNYQAFKTKASIDSFVVTKDFLNYPSISLDTDSLRTVLVQQSDTSIEGIYHYDRFYQVGLFKSGFNEYTGVILSSTVNLWKKGQVAIHLYEYAPGLYKAIYGHPFYKYFIFQPIEKYRNQSLLNAYFYGSYTQSTYSKYPERQDYINLVKSGNKFAFKNPDQQVQYLLIQSFQADRKTVQASAQFFDSIKTALNAPNLLLDLRNNECGADKEMIKYFKLLKQYVKKGHLYVLLNNGTLSQAELFTLQLKKLKNVTTLGQSTRGMLAYGSNYGKTEHLPSGKFALYPTDMNNGAAVLPFESIGIRPDIVLKDDRNWIEQALEIIKNK